MKLLQRSLVARIIASLLAISGMAFISITLTMAMSSGTRGDAAAINVAGSLRMNAHQIMGELQRVEYAPETASESRFKALMTRFDQRLQSATLQQNVRSGDRHTQLENIQAYWQRMLRPRLNEAASGGEIDLDALQVMITTVVSDIDTLVMHLEHSTEAKVRLLGMMQILFLALIAIVVLIALYDVRHNLVVPLRQLMVLAREAAQRNFGYRSRLRGSDELALLGHTFNKMSAELSSSYAALEEKVSRKEQELERSNQALRVMHDASRSLYGGGNDLCSSAAPMLRELETLLDIGPIRLSLNDPFDQREMPVLETHSHTRPEYCRDQECNACLIDPRPLDMVASDQAQCLLLPISVGDTLLGTIELWYPQDRLNNSTRRLLTMLADQLATAVYLQRRIEEQQQVTLINERTIIARELHDSLAQSLSYLKMQVARLERMQQKAAPQEAQTAVFDELRNGLNSAYRQLRELLTTFRLKLDGPGLQFALRQTVDEFTHRIGANVELDYDVPPYLLNPNEEIHVLQIIREALANTHKHAQAHWAAVTVRFTNAQMLIRIEDDGIGLKDDSSPPMHYGLVIIRDRATTLNGELSITNRSTGGACVELVFTPLTARLIQQQPASTANHAHTDTHLGTRTS
ncbi:MAG: type IV pili methyl-accepting chemotaxis transducer N-terminal domain-containing protein [Halomonas sp.]|nr:histidine kinase [Halomonas sp.]MBP5980543.1 type IV pili methyl-accepting chemotaxis transducer N-terminal domain-containing protein [Halomonas sp.]